MDTAVEEIIAQVLQTPSKERAVIAERLISSLDTAADLDVEIAWQEEIRRRIVEADKGDVVCIPWEVVRDQLRRNAVAAN
ncbi:addiction module protein [bacterium]|nr:addiction module protein [bacterium]MBU1752318.1 addiction module protein [bacterium]